MAPSDNPPPCEQAVGPPYPEHAAGATVLAASDLGRRPDGEYGTRTVVGFEHYLDDSTGALVRLDPDLDHVDWFPLFKLHLIPTRVDFTAHTVDVGRCSWPRKRRSAHAQIQLGAAVLALSAASSDHEAVSECPR